MAQFNQAFNQVFSQNQLTLGIFFPLESFAGDMPKMENQEALAKSAEDAGFSALWFRDVPLRDPDFGDAGQIYDTFVYLSWIAAHTNKIALATGSIILPIRHPLHVAKSVASIDRLSNGRLILGIASGDRPIEFPAFGVDKEHRDSLFREHLESLRTSLNDRYPAFNNTFGSMYGVAETIPKPEHRVPFIATGNSRQDLEWLSKNTDGWLTYARPLSSQLQYVNMWKGAVQTNAEGVFKPFAQSLYLDLAQEPDEKVTPIHLGIKCGRNVLLEFLKVTRKIGVNHVALNLKFSSQPVKEVIEELAEYVLPNINSEA